MSDNNEKQSLLHQDPLPPNAPAPEYTPQHLPPPQTFHAGEATSTKMSDNNEKQSLLHQDPLPPTAPAPEYTPQQLPPPQTDAPQPPPYQQGQQGYQAVSAAPQTIILTPALIEFDSTPVNMRCPNCQRDIVTSVQFENGMLTWLLVLLMFLLGFALCCCIPCCITATKDAVHTCPNCRHICGVHKKIG